MENILTLFRSDFEYRKIWIQICEQLDIPISSDKVNIAFSSVDFSQDT